MDWTSGLNTEQIEAVEHDHGPLLILAGAGSGKTTVLVHRAGRLIDQRVVDADRMCVLTFTNKAARELKSRVAHKLGNRAKGLWAGTFHSFGLQLLRRFHKRVGLSRDFGVLDPSDAGSIMKELLKEFDNAGKSGYDAGMLQSMVASWRESGQRDADKEDEYEEAVEWMLPRYLKRLERLGTVDFDSLILKPIELLESDAEARDMIREGFTHLMVDEFQDTNRTQMKLIRLLVDPHRNLAVVGDDDQSIYGWRGACIANILDFPKHYSGCKVVRLEQNYRSTPAILDIANAVIAKNTRRHGKVLRASPTSERGAAPELLIFNDENEEAEGVANEISELMREGYPKHDIAVLYRSNSQGAQLEAELRKSQIPYKMSGGTAFFDRQETRDVLAYLRCSLKPTEVAFRRILNTPPRGIGDKTVDTLTDFSDARGIAFPAAARQWKEAGVEDRAGHAIDSLSTTLSELGNGTTGARLLQVMETIGYRTHLEKRSPNAVAATKKWGYVGVLAGVLDRFLAKGSTVRDFVDAMELRDTPDDEETKDTIHLLTLHACKGLEFPAVILMGVEEDILPHKKLGSDISEERRLFYVGVTRAKKRLILTRTRRRMRHGRPVDVAPSRFLLEIPKEMIVERKGHRPITEDRRKSMLADLFKKLDSMEGTKPI